MNWNAVGAISEVVGAIGVIVSLLYLATQIKIQNREQRLGAANELTRQWNEFLGSQADNGELASIWLRGINDFEDLEPLERFRFSSHAGRITRVLEGLYLHHREGSLAQDAWDGIDRTIRDVFAYAGGRAWWKTRAHWYSSSFQAYMGEVIKVAVSHPNLYGEKDESDG